MRFAVRFTTGARSDLRAIHASITRTDSVENADRVSREIVRAALRLGNLAHRGTNPPELARQGRRVDRQIFFKPYRILYRICGDTVFIGLIADGRRDTAPLLARRFAAP